MSLFNSHFLMFVAWVGAFDHQIWLQGKAFEHNFGLGGGGGGGVGQDLNMPIISSSSARGLLGEIWSFELICRITAW